MDTSADVATAVTRGRLRPEQEVEAIRVVKPLTRSSARCAIECRRPRPPKNKKSNDRIFEVATAPAARQRHAQTAIHYGE